MPGITYVVERTRPGCSVADVLRLERLVLDRLGWQLRLVTPLSFLHSLHCLLVAACPGLLADRPQRLSPHRQLIGLTERLLELVTDGRSLGVPPACLAAALICCELQRCGVETAPFVQAAHRLIKVSTGWVRGRCAWRDGSRARLLPCVAIIYCIDTSLALIDLSVSRYACVRYFRQ